MEDNQPQPCKFPRTGNGAGTGTGTGRRAESAKLVQEMGLSELQHPKGEAGGRGRPKASSRAVGIDESARIRGWPHHSRIVRVSRASGGKDRHSKVLTSKGLRDRRVRLSVPTAIQFYDIQDRLGYNQPSKAVEWLIKAAADSISELPSLIGSFTGSSPTGQQSSDEKRTSEENASEQHGFDSAEVEMDGDSNPNSQYCQQNQNPPLAKSACSSASETSKGSGCLSLSRSELHNNGVCAHERARERTAKERKDSGGNHQPLNLISQSSSFTELLTGGIGMSNTVNAATTSNGPSGSIHQDSGDGTRRWSLASMDYFTSGLLSAPLSRNSSRFAGQLQMANNQIPQALPIPQFAVSSGSDGGNHHELPPPQYSFVHEGFIPLAAATASSMGEEYKLNFTISSSSSGSPDAGLGGFNRGTLQSNSSSQQPSHLQRFSAAVDGPPSSPHHQNVGVPFFIGTAVPLDNHSQHNNQFPPGFDGRLHLYYGHGDISQVRCTCTKHRRATNQFRRGEGLSDEPEVQGYSLLDYFSVGLILYATKQ